MKFDYSKIDVEHFLESLDIRNVEAASSDEWQFSCPFPGHAYGDETPSAYMNDETTAWHCFGCKRSGNAVSFLSEQEGVSILEARRWLREEYDKNWHEPAGGMTSWWRNRFASSEPDIDIINPPVGEDALDLFEIDWEDAWDAYHSDVDNPIISYMFDRGFSKETLIEWQIGYDERTGRFTIPVRSEDGSLIGFKGRAWDREAQPKYLNIGDRKSTYYGFSPYKKSHVVFGMNKVGRRDALILCEGELNVIAMHQSGFDNAVGISGSELSEFQAKIIKWHTDEVILFFDSLKYDGDGNVVEDPAGQKCTSDVINLLESFMTVRVVPDHLSDPADMEPQEIATLIECSESSVARRLVRK